MYVDAFIDRDKDKFHVAERVDGKRILRVLSPDYSFYYADTNGKHTAITGEKATKQTIIKNKDFRRDMNIYSGHRTFEADVNPLFKSLEKHYPNAKTPELHIAYIDIEVDWDKDQGYASPDKPFMPVTAFSAHLGWLNKTITLVLKPKQMDREVALDICSRFEDTSLMDDEAHLLDTMLKILDDADIITHWNGETFDIPYLIGRITEKLGKDSNRRLCLWNQMPKKGTVKMFGKEQTKYDLVGRVSLDYLQLFKKHAGQSFHSYRLGFIGKVITGESKVEYEGTLDQLYNNDFEKFILYNRQDAELVLKIDKIKKFIQLANEIAHVNGVLLQTTMGSVQLMDNAITLEAHSRNLIVPTKKKESVFEEIDDREYFGEDDEETTSPHETQSGAVGAHVSDPKLGFHEWIGVTDINSLYPSVIRSLNMSPETLIAQLRPTYTEPFVYERYMKTNPKSWSEAWHGIFNVLEYDLVMNKDEEHPIDIDFNSGESYKMTGKEIHELIFDGSNKWDISANGTIFTLEREGVVPGVLTRWFTERKQMQAKAKSYAGILKAGFKLDDDLLKKLSS